MPRPVLIRNPHGHDFHPLLFTCRRCHAPLELLTWMRWRRGCRPLLCPPIITAAVRAELAPA